MSAQHRRRGTWRSGHRSSTHRTDDDITSAGWVSQRVSALTAAMSQCAAAVHDYLTSKCSPRTALAKVDLRLQELCALPSFHSDKYEHMPWSRHIWQLCVQHKRLVIYRPLFARSFRDPKYTFARKVCVEAARSILIERRKFFPPSYEKPWVVLFDTLSAAVVLAIDFFHTPTSGLDTRRAEIYELLNALTRGLQHNTYVQRASGLLLALLAEEDKFRASFEEQSRHSGQDQSPPLEMPISTQSDGLNPSPETQRMESESDIWAWLNLESKAPETADASGGPADSSFLFNTASFEFFEM